MADVLIAGGGIVGSGLAWALARRGVSGVTVVDLDLSGAFASSELNAGGARATWWQEVNVASCAATLDFFRAHAEEFGFRELGYLWLYDRRERFEQAERQRALQNRYDLGVQTLDRAALQERFAWIDGHTDELVGATFSPRDGLVNPNAVRAFYRREATALGVRFLDRHYIAGVETSLDGRGRRAVRAVNVVELRPQSQGDSVRDALVSHHIRMGNVAAEARLPCDTLVNCLGAWAPLLSSKLGVDDPTRPVRRQIALFAAQPGPEAPPLDASGLGMVVDTSDVYFHPEADHFLAGYSDPAEPAGYDFHYEGSAFFERDIWPRLARRSSQFERCRHRGGWSGLYAVTPDCSGIAGPVDGLTNVYEAHSFTGRGVMQSYGVATALAARIATGRYEELDLAPLARTRFADRARWLPEDLHI